MEVLCFTPSYSPLLRTNFTGKDAFKPSPAIVRRSSSRLKPLIYAAVSKPLKASSSSTAAADNDEKLKEVSPDCVYFPSGYLIPNEDKGHDVTLDPVAYLSDILLSKVYDVANVSPLQEASQLYNELQDVRFWVKRDDEQPVFSFKLRGAYNMMSKLSKQQLDRGVITASAGNHAQGVALAAKTLGCSAKIVMPETTPEIKQNAVRRLGGDIELYGQSFDDAQAHALELAETEDRVFIPPFDHQDIIVGQGTVGMEIVQQRQDQIEAIFVPIGGGGLVSGIAAYVRAILPDVKIIGVEPYEANGMALSFHFRERVALKWVGNFADGVAVKVVGKETYNVCKQLIDGVVLVNDCQISAAIKDVYEESRTILEPSGALALAGAKAYCDFNKIKDKSVVAVCSGANMDFEKIRLVVDLSEIGRGREAMLSTYIPEEPGSLDRLCRLVVPLNITEFKYRYNSDKEKALVQYSVGYRTEDDLVAMLERLESAQLQTINHSDDDLVQKHLRYLVGGRSSVDNEVFCKFVLPEGAGSLLKFLDGLGSRWNISLVHYQTQGSAVANVLFGIQVPDSEIDEFQKHANHLGYDYQLYPKNPSARHLMG